MSMSLTAMSGVRAAATLLKTCVRASFWVGLPPQDVQEQALVGASDLLANARFTIDEENQRVSATMFGLFERTAIVTPGIG